MTQKKINLDVIIQDIKDKGKGVKIMGVYAICPHCKKAISYEMKRWGDKADHDAPPVSA